MSYGYPDGCTQATHDSAFNELGPSPAELAAEADAQNDFETDYPDMPEEQVISKWRPSPPEEFITKRDAASITRVFVRLEQQIQHAAQEGRHDDAKAMCRIFGAASYRAYGANGTELGERP